MKDSKAENALRPARAKYHEPANSGRPAREGEVASPQALKANAGTTYALQQP